MEGLRGSRQSYSAGYAGRMDATHQLGTVDGWMSYCNVEVQYAAASDSGKYSIPSLVWAATSC